jgi:DNA-binding MarR family transcriptional regulator
LRSQVFRKELEITTFANEDSSGLNRFGSEAPPGTIEAMTDWLDDEEMAAWRGMIDVYEDVMASLEVESVERHGLTGGDYAVLVTLSEAPDERLRMCDLAVSLHLSPSGITRRLDGMVKQGLVAREPSTADRRVMLAVLTPDGREALEAAAPDHVEAVRRHFLDHLSRTQIRNLAAAFAAVGRGRDRGDRTTHDAA